MVNSTLATKLRLEGEDKGCVLLFGQDQDRNSIFYILCRQKTIPALLVVVNEQQALWVMHRCFGPYMWNVNAQEHQV